ncbi:hypothetical protein PIB30_006848 [Stylosanthes scabra]|uniref:Uncharacterized protein n=1 Tax=Stylosanthes scabra TaxID=79078 RepID=A0ABU6V4Q1_9FABA|nr:hypothetical protein [Stylosanthes scabra]
MSERVEVNKVCCVLPFDFGKQISLLQLSSKIARLSQFGGGIEGSFAASSNSQENPREQVSRGETSFGEDEGASYSVYDGHESVMIVDGISSFDSIDFASLLFDIWMRVLLPVTCT